jgi:NADPH2:quinone reductase
MEKYMRAIEITAPGNPEVLALTDRPQPRPGAGEILIRVASAGINMPDIFQRKGGYPPPEGVTDIPGLEVAGEVAACGEGVSGFSKGDPVCALLAGGGYAEYAVAPASTVLPIPRGLDVLHAAALPETAFTVWDALFMRARLQPGESVLIHGGCGGIGSMALQLARACGCSPIFTTGHQRDGQAEACRRFGATRFIDYREEDFVEVVKQQTDGRGVDVIQDIIGGDYVARNIESLAVEGRLVNLNFVAGIEVKVDFRPVMRKRLTLMAQTLRARTAEEKGRIAAQLLQHVWPWIEAGKVTPEIFRTYPLAEAASAHAALEAGGHIGKIVLTL